MGSLSWAGRLEADPSVNCIWVCLSGAFEMDFIVFEKLCS